MENSPKVIGKIDLPNKEVLCCAWCGYNSPNFTVKVRNEVYGTWSDEDICEECYYTDMEKGFGII